MKAQSRAYLLLIAIMLAIQLVACPGGVQIAAQTLNATITTSNQMADALKVAQEQARARRKAEMMRAAETATSREDGERQLDQIEARFAPVMEAFSNAAIAHTALTSCLALAQKAVESGEVPDVNEIIRLLGEAQGMYREIISMMSRE